MAGQLDIPRVFHKLRTTKRWWIPTALLTILAVNAIGLLKPEQYTAEGQVIIHQSTLSDAKIRETFRTDDTLDTLKARITSPHFLATIAGKVGLDKGIDPRSREFDNLLKRMADSIYIAQSPELFRITYTGYSAQEAYDVTLQIIRDFIAESGRFYDTKTQNNVDLLNTQLKQEILKMKEAQEALKNYKNAHINEIPEAQKEHMDRLAKARDTQADAKRELVEMQNLYQLAQIQLAKTPPTISKEVRLTDNSEVKQLQDMRRSLKLKLDSLLQDFHEAHPEVKDTRAHLSRIEEELSSATLTQSTEVTTEPNPLYTQLQMQITGYMLNIGALEKGITEQEPIIKELEEYLHKIPQRQAELTTLEREYATANMQVDDLRRRLTEATQASYLMQQGGGPSFDIQSPPRMPTSPSSPDRIKIGIASIALGGMAAAGLILLFAWLDGTMRSLDDARHVLRMPMLGMVQRIVTPSQLRMLRRRRIARAIGMAVFLVMLGAGGYAAFHFYRDDLIIGMSRISEFMKQ